MGKVVDGDIVNVTVWRGEGWVGGWGAELRWYVDLEKDIKVNNMSLWNLGRDMMGNSSCRGRRGRFVCGY